jgi:hypothetical protein
MMKTGDYLQGRDNRLRNNARAKDIQWEDYQEFYQPTEEQLNPPDLESLPVNNPYQNEIFQNNYNSNNNAKQKDNKKWDKLNFNPTNILLGRATAATQNNNPNNNPNAAATTNQYAGPQPSSSHPDSTTLQGRDQAVAQTPEPNQEEGEILDKDATEHIQPPPEEEPATEENAPVDEPESNQIVVAYEEQLEDDDETSLGRKGKKESGSLDGSTLVTAGVVGAVAGAAGVAVGAVGLAAILCVTGTICEGKPLSQPVFTKGEITLVLPGIPAEDDFDSGGTNKDDLRSQVEAFYTISLAKKFGSSANTVSPNENAGRKFDFGPKIETTVMPLATAFESFEITEFNGELFEITTNEEIPWTQPIGRANNNRCRQVIAYTGRTTILGYPNSFYDPAVVDIAVQTSDQNDLLENYIKKAGGDESVYKGTISVKTVSNTTFAPTTAAPTVPGATNAPTPLTATTKAPTVPTTTAPTGPGETNAPTTLTPKPTPFPTSILLTQAPTAGLGVTNAPTAPTTTAPTVAGATSAPTPVAATTAAPTMGTSAPTTAAATTTAPTMGTSSPTTAAATTTAPTMGTSAPTTAAATTTAPTMGTSAPTTLAGLGTSAPTTVAATTTAPTAATAAPTAFAGEATAPVSLAPTRKAETIAPTAANEIVTLPAELQLTYDAAATDRDLTPAEYDELRSLLDEYCSAEFQADPAFLAEFVSCTNTLNNMIYVPAGDPHITILFTIDVAFQAGSSPNSALVLEKIASLGPATFISDYLMRQPPINQLDEVVVVDFVGTTGIARLTDDLKFVEQSFQGGQNRFASTAAHPSFKPPVATRSPVASSLSPTLTPSKIQSHSKTPTSSPSSSTPSMAPSPYPTPKPTTAIPTTSPTRDVASLMAQLQILLDMLQSKNGTRLEDVESQGPSRVPSSRPSTAPSRMPSRAPTTSPSEAPSNEPSSSNLAVEDSQLDEVLTLLQELLIMLKGDGN